MSNLKTYKFSQLYAMSSGISSKPEQAGHGAPFVSFSTAFNNYFVPDVLPDLMDISEKEKGIYSIKKGDILLTRTSETLDELGMSSVAIKDYPNSSFSGFLKRLRPTQDDVTYDKFMAFYLRSKLFRKTMNNNAVMTLRASLNENIFSYLDLILPEYSEQKKIGDFLHLLNCKIELNNKINAELEDMAKLIYDYWFVQFDFPNTEGKPYKSSGGKMVYNEELKREIPEGWEVEELKDLGKIVTGKTPSSKIPEYMGSGIPFITPTDFNSNKKFFTNAERTVSDSGQSMYKSYILPEGTILITCIGSDMGKIGISASECMTNQQINSIVLNESYNTEFAYQYLKSLYQYLKMIAQAGSTMPIINKTTFEKIKVLKPNHLVLKSFHNKLKAANLRNISITQENQQLASLRDWLLPMLMNGQVTVRQTHGNAVKEAEEKVSELYSHAEQSRSMAAEPKVKYNTKN